MKAIILLAILAFAMSAYDRDKAVAYAKKWYNGANHDCKKSYESCSPYSYWGKDSCGYSSHGGDCANFVSQCLVEAGHSKLTKAPCRGYPCGVEEVGANNLGKCLAKNYGWTSTCGHLKAPPSNIKKGDVLVYHESSCDDYEAHATIVVKGGSDAQIACHSSNQYGKDYNYMASSKPYYEWIHYEG